MSNFIDIIENRRSIRKYTQQLVPAETLRAILETASFAPSAHNAQPWRFILLTKSEGKHALADAMAKVWLEELKRDHIPKRTRLATVKRSVERFTTAPVLIVACITLKEMDIYPDNERGDIERDLAVQSLAAAIQTMLLAAHAWDLGSCWYCAPIFCKKAVRQTLQIPDNVEPQALITLGYPDEIPKTPHRNPLEDYAYRDSWCNSL